MQVPGLAPGTVLEGNVMQWWALFRIFDRMATTNEEEHEKQEKKSQTSASESRGFIADLLLNAFEPGVNSSVLIFLNLVFFLLLVTLVAVMFITGINLHIIFLGILALGLMIGLNV